MLYHNYIVCYLLLKTILRKIACETGLGNKAEGGKSVQYICVYCFNRKKRRYKNDNKSKEIAEEKGGKRKKGEHVKIHIKNKCLKTELHINCSE